MNKNFIQQNFKKISFISLLVLALLILIATFINQQTKPAPKEGKFNLSIKLVPGDTKIKIDNQEYQAPLSINLLPGVYRVEYFKDGFQTYSFNLRLNQDTNIYDSLEPSDDDSDVAKRARQWKEANIRLYNEVNAQAQTQASEQSASVGEKFPLLKKLPKQSTDYDIGSYINKNNPDLAVITISANQENYHKAVSFLKNQRYDLSTYSYRFLTKEGADDKQPNPFKLEKSRF